MNFLDLSHKQSFLRFLLLVFFFLLTSLVIHGLPLVVEHFSPQSINHSSVVHPLFSYASFLSPASPGIKE